jgi:hypothetical protein
MLFALLSPFSSPSLLHKITLVLFFFLLIKKKKITCWVPVAHTCNPSCLGSRDQEDRGLKPAWANSL